MQTSKVKNTEKLLEDLKKTNMAKCKVIEKADGSIVLRFSRDAPEFLCNGQYRQEKRIRPPIDYSGAMPTANYARTLNRKFYILQELSIDQKKCRFVTLTIDDTSKNNYQDISSAFKTFMQGMRRHAKANNNEVKYIRGIEVQEESERFHIHVVLVYENPPPYITNEMLRKHWQFAEAHLNLKVNVYDAYGLLGYLCNFKEGSLDKALKYYTHFPKGVQIIAMSRGFERAEVQDIDMYNALKLAEGAKKKSVQEHKFRGQDGKIHKVTDGITLSIPSQKHVVRKVA